MVATREARPSFHWGGVCIDCVDAEELADFYGRLLGWKSPVATSAAS
jgi:hypothetical protein